MPATGDREEPESRRETRITEQLPVAPQAGAGAAAGATRTRTIPTVPLLVFVEGERTGSEVPLGRAVVLGRDAGAADVILGDDPEVSRRHATFSPAGPPP